MYIEFKNREKPGIKAENLNKMQDMIQSSIVEVSQSNKMTSDSLANTNSEVDDLKTENKYLNSVVEQAFTPVEKEGTSITYDNTINARFKDIKLLGNTTQDGTPTPDNPVDINVVTGNQNVKVYGKNMLDGSKISTGTKNGITLSYDKNTQIFTIDGTCETDNTVFDLNQFFNIKSNTTNLFIYYISGKYTSYGGFRLADKNWEYNLTVRLRELTSNNSIIKVTSSTSFDAVNNGFRFDTGTTADNFKIKIMVANSTDNTYEPYQDSTYPLSLGSMELCKIGDYQDYIYKKDDKWFKHKEIAKEKPDTNNWLLDDSNNVIYQYSNPVNVKTKNDELLVLSTYYNGVPFETNDLKSWNIDNSITTLFSRGGSIRIMTSKQTNLNDFKNWVSNKDLGIRAVIKEPIEEQITDTTLITQLNSLSKATTYAGETNIVATSDGLTIIPKTTALTK